jgi:hypothetical protein
MRRGDLNVFSQIISAFPGYHVMQIEFRGRGRKPFLEWELQTF